jgi:hypothetical protein
MMIFMKTDEKCFKNNSSHKFGLFYLHAINSYEELILGRITVSKHYNYLDE